MQKKGAVIKIIEGGKGEWMKTYNLQPGITQECAEGKNREINNKHRNIKLSRERGQKKG